MIMVGGWVCTEKSQPFDTPILDTGGFFSPILKPGEILVTLYLSLSFITPRIALE
jgi:hypothetical protein